MQHTMWRPVSEVSNYKESKKWAEMAVDRTMGKATAIENNRTP